MAVRARRGADAQKKTIHASEQERPDVARRRAQWQQRQGQLDPARLVFIDETWTKTNMSPLRGWAPKGQRLIGRAPYGHWNTMTFLAALRHDRTDAPFLLEGPIDRVSFLTYVETVLAPAPKPGDLVVADNLPCHKRPEIRTALRAVGAHRQTLAQLHTARMRKLPRKLRLPQT